MTTSDALLEVERELNAAEKRFPPMNTAHEGYAIILEEMDELWQHIRMKQGMRLTHEMRREAMQIAAMAVRFMKDICNSEKGNL